MLMTSGMTFVYIQYLSRELKCIFYLISDLIVTNIFVCSLIVVVNSPAEGKSCM